METQPTTNQMKRGEFIRNLGLSSAALMSFYCMGTLTSCSSSNDPAPATGTGGTTPPTTSSGLTGNAETSKGAINFTLDLTSADFKALKTAGEFAKIGDVLVASVKGGSYVAVQRLCTHNDLDGLSYRLGSDDIGCSIHGSVFATTGTVKGGPATSALRLYKTALSTDGNKLTITA